MHNRLEDQPLNKLFGICIGSSFYIDHFIVTQHTWGVNCSTNRLNVGSMWQNATVVCLAAITQSDYMSIMVLCTFRALKVISGSEKPPLQRQHGMGRKSLLGLLKFVLLFPQGPQHLYRVRFPSELFYSFLPEVKQEDYKERFTTNCGRKHIRSISAQVKTTKLTKGEEMGCIRTPPLR